MSEPQRIDQTAVGEQGNCQSACIAMLLGLPLSAVPNFTLEADDAARSVAMHNWLLARGWGLVRVSPSRHACVGFYIAGGTSPRGIEHAVIYKDGELWHDPHPERGGIAKVTEIDVIYPLRPFEIQREIAVLTVKANGSLANNLCSDHFEKQVGKPCLACVIDELNRTIVEHDEHLSACGKELLEARQEIARYENGRLVLTNEIERLNGLINTPHTHDFIEGVRLEMPHQRERWGAEHDAGKTALDWFWLIGYLAQKATYSFLAGDIEKAKHHVITTAAALGNWFLAITGENTSMRPGIADGSQR